MLPHHHSTRGRKSKEVGDSRYHPTCELGLIGSFHGHMVQNHTRWDASCTVGLSKQRQVNVDWQELFVLEVSLALDCSQSPICGCQEK